MAAATASDLCNFFDGVFNEFDVVDFVDFTEGVLVIFDDFTEVAFL